MYRLALVSFALCAGLFCLACGGAKTAYDPTVHTFDTNNDGRTDAWHHLESIEGTIKVTLKEYDLNHDGKIDVIRAFNENGAIVRDELDFDFDGKIDQWTYYENGIISRVELDYTFDGKPEVFKYFQEGVLVRVERDLNNDGNIDHIEHYNAQGEIESVQSDDNGDGRFETAVDPPSESEL